MKKIAIIGSGATAIYLLKHLMDSTRILKNYMEEITIFEKGDILGMGMPYNPHTTDLYNLFNIASPWPIQKILPKEGQFHNWHIRSIAQCF